ncbi:hypothetical protein [Streptomyces sp. LN704]|uniref:hypothetical protein n=1 Tax=Streptomyces sp. LN704 TaxID=3112982 RepID=UPI003719BBE1
MADEMVLQAQKFVNATYGSRNGSDSVRRIQQWPNGRYVNRRDFFIVPCDGIYSRDVAKAMIFNRRYGVAFEGSLTAGLADAVREFQAYVRSPVTTSPRGPRCLSPPATSPVRASRRTLLSRTAAVVGATVLASSTGNVLPAHAAARPDGAQVPGGTVTGRPSLNGWETGKSTDDGGNIWTRRVPGTPLDGVQVRMGDTKPF